jgi:signal transduction histidine kinase
LREDHHIRVSIEDNGQGFDANQVRRENRPYFGLQIMRERAESVGGKITIDAGQGRGTRISVEIPVNPDKW